MKIYKKLYGYILNNVSKKPPESGGILGKKNGIVCNVYFDKGIITEKMCSYEPNVELLNNIIEKWQQENIDFCGIFHTHFYGVKTLSDGDKEYINRIITAMPENINKLYFPIVLPEYNEMVNYMARKKNQTVIINKSDIIVEE